MDRQSLLVIYGYNAYANGVLLGMAAQLSETELQTPSPSRDSIYRLLLHMFYVEDHFLRRCTGVAFQPVDLPTLDVLRAHWLEVAREVNEYLTSTTDHDLRCEIAAFSQSDSFRLPRWQLLFQAFNHSATHRGELSILLSQLGHPLAVQDIIRYLARESGQAWPLGR